MNEEVTDLIEALKVRNKRMPYEAELTINLFENGGTAYYIAGMNEAFSFSTTEEFIEKAVKEVELYEATFGGIE